MAALICEKIGAGGGILGAFLVASPDLAIYGFSCWVVSNSAWIRVGIHERKFYSTAMFSVFLCTAIAGVVLRLGVI